MEGDGVGGMKLSMKVDTMVILLLFLFLRGGGDEAVK